jgi:hypothetical protein
MPVTRADRLMTLFGVEYTKEELLQRGNFCDRQSQVHPGRVQPHHRAPGSDRWRQRAAKKAKAKIALVAKYADPKTGKTWSGFGRAPGWIAGEKNPDALVVGKGAPPDSATKTPAAAK